MKNICLYFQIHHPIQYQIFRYLDIGKSKNYYMLEKNRDEICSLAHSSYLPTNKFLLSLLKKMNGKLKLSFYISGTTLDLFMMFCPEVLTSFRKLAETGNVEFIGGNTAHTISSFQSSKEFKLQISKHKNRLLHYFGQNPKLILDSDFFFPSKNINESGYEAILINNLSAKAQKINPNYIYSNSTVKSDILVRNESFSKEFGKLFIASDSNSDLMINNIYNRLIINLNEPIINIFTDYDIICGDIRKNKVLKAFCLKVINSNYLIFSRPEEILTKYGSIGDINIDNQACFAERFNSLQFPINRLQKEAMEKLFKLEKKVNKSNDINLKSDWLYLQTSDNFHLMNENSYSEGKAINICNFKSKYEAFINYMNILEDLKLRVKQLKKKRKVKDVFIKQEKTIET